MNLPDQNPPSARRIVIIGAGMAGARLAEELRQHQPDPGRLSIVLIGAEPEQPYNRIMLSHMVSGSFGDQTSLRLKPSGWWERHHIELRTDCTVTAIDREQQQVHLAGGERLGYHELVLATGAEAAVPPIEGIRAGPGLAHGVHCLRDAADCAALIAHMRENDGPIVLVGGGFIGLEVACALARTRREVAVIHPREWPMDSHLDAGGGRVLMRALHQLGVVVHTGSRAARWTPASGGAGGVVTLGDGTEIHAGTVVLSAGTRPRAELAEAAGLAVGAGICVDARLATADPHIFALGDCAEQDGKLTGLVAPAWDQASVLAARLAVEDAQARHDPGLSITRLKAHGVDVVSLGHLVADPYAPDVHVTTISEPARGRYARVDVELSGDVGRLVGAVLVGHPEPVGILTQMYEHALPVPEDLLSVVLGRVAAEESPSPARLPGSALICRCNGVTKSDLVSAFRGGARTVETMSERTRAGTGCGGCADGVKGICGWLREADPTPEEEASTAAEEDSVVAGREDQRECA